jgi:hypothetical protein
MSRANVVVFSFSGRQRKSISLARTKLQVHRLEAELARVNKELAERPFFLPVSTLSPRPAEILKPLCATVTREDGCFVASFCEANINASGSSRSEAMEMLKDAIVSAYYVLSDLEGELGEEPMRQLSVLREFIRER